MSKLIKIDEIAEFAGKHHTGYIEVPNWVVTISVDRDGSIWGNDRIPTPKTLWNYQQWDGGRMIQLTPEFSHNEPYVRDWAKWYWEVPA